MSVTFGYTITRMQLFSYGFIDGFKVIRCRLSCSLCVIEMSIFKVKFVNAGFVIATWVYLRSIESK